MAGKGGGSWKVAYADFVTAMMAFFLVMWITAQSKSVRQAISQYFSDPHGSSGRPSGVSEKTAGGTSMFPTKRSGDAPYVHGGKGAMGRGTGAADMNLEDPPNDPDEEIKTKRPNLFIMHHGNNSLMGATVQFNENAIELDEWAKNRLKAVAPMFRGKPNKIEIRGHATRRPLTYNGPQPDLWQISYARCLATMKFLESEGIEPERMRLSQAAAYEPYSQRSETEWQAQNSRVDVYMLGDFINEPKTGGRRPLGKNRLPAAPESEAPKAAVHAGDEPSKHSL